MKRTNACPFAAYIKTRDWNRYMPVIGFWAQLGYWKFCMNIFVGNLDYASTEETLRQLFEQHGEITSVKIIIDRETGRSRGFGFVEMPNDEEGKKAIEATNGMDLDGRTLNVNEARPRSERPAGGPRPGGMGAPRGPRPSQPPQY